MHLIKNSLEVVWPFCIFSKVHNSKIFMNTPLKKFFEVVLLVLKIFLGANFENIHEYTFEKIL